MKCHWCRKEAQHAVSYWSGRKHVILCFCDPDLEEWLDIWSDSFWRQKILELDDPLVTQAPQWKYESLAYWPGSAILPCP